MLRHEKTSELTSQTSVLAQTFMHQDQELLQQASLAIQHSQQWTGHLWLPHMLLEQLQDFYHQGHPALQILKASWSQQIVEPLGQVYQATRHPFYTLLVQQRRCLTSLLHLFQPSQAQLLLVRH
jgi:hypothetical protein